MSTYTPTTEEVRNAYADSEFEEMTPKLLAEFDRWLSEVERAARKRGWDEALSALADNGGITAGPNPYQQKGQDDE